MPEKVYRRRYGVTYLIILIAAIVMYFMPDDCSGAQWHRAKWHKAQGAVWNTTYSITYRADRDLADSISAVFREVEMSLSPFNPASRISLINRGESMQTDSLIARVFGISQRVCSLSGGNFDPTVSPLVNLWGFGYSRRPADGKAPAPTQAEIDSALRLVGIADCLIVNGLMEKKAPGTTFNFSAVTKGYGCDLIGAMLTRNGCEDYMVEIGGEMALRGHNPRGTDWQVQIDAPVEGAATHEAMRVVALTDCGVATSGNYRNFRVDSLGRHLGHTISPRDGRPYATDILSATVVAPTCAEADALATACMASPEADAVAMLKGMGDVRALLVVADGDTLRQIRVRGL